MGQPCWDDWCFTGSNVSVRCQDARHPSKPSRYQQLSTSNFGICKSRLQSKIQGLHPTHELFAGLLLCREGDRHEWPLNFLAFFVKVPLVLPLGKSMPQFF